jgi:hypothetical protein
VLLSIGLSGDSISRLPVSFALGETTKLFGLKNDLWTYIGKGTPIVDHRRDKWNEAFDKGKDFFRFEGSNKSGFERCEIFFPKVDGNFCQIDLSVLQKIFWGIEKKNMTAEGKTSENGLTQQAALKNYWKRDSRWVWNDWEGAFYVYLFIKAHMRGGDKSRGKGSSGKVYQNSIIKYVPIGRDRVLKNLKWFQDMGIFRREKGVDNYGNDFSLWKELI